MQPDLLPDPKEKWTFRTRIMPTDKVRATQSYATWVKCRSAVMDAFPDAYKHEFHHKLVLYGTQRMWFNTWIDRFKNTKDVGESELDINLCWANLILCVPYSTSL